MTATSGRPDPTAGRQRSAALTVGFVAIVALVVWLVVRPSGDEGIARSDASLLARSIAQYIGETGEMPAVGVTVQTLAGGDVVWGPDYLVGDQPIARTEPDRGRPFFVVGRADRWCVEVQYIPPVFFSDSVSPEWVAARGSGGAVGKVMNGRCGDGYAFLLSPVTQFDVPQPGSVVDAAQAVVGTCLTELLGGGRSTGPLEVVDCRDAHFAEIYHAGEINDDDYGRFQDSAAEQCAAAFRAFVGVPHNVSSFTGEPFTVDEATWSGGDRQYSCVLFLGTEDYPLVGSAQNSRR